MTISPVQNHTPASAAIPVMYGDNSALAQSAGLKAKAGSANDPAEIKKAAGQFEAIMLRQLLAPSIEPMMSGGLGGASAPGGGIYGYMLTDAIAGSISKGGGLGLSAMIEKQLTPRSLSADIKSGDTHKPSTR